MGCYKRPAFTWASQNVAATATVLDMLLAPFANVVNRLYRQLREIIAITAMQ
jgi:hypothetical protein